MTFVSPFQSPFVNPFPSASAAVEPWYLSGGIAAANCIAAYQPKGAASLAASYSNLANPGTYDAVVPAGKTAPTWDATNGWIRDSQPMKQLDSQVNPSASSWSFIIRFSNYTGGPFRYVGKVDTNKNMTFAVEEAAGDFGYYNHGLLNVTGGKLTSGVICIAGQTGYRNASSDGTIPSAWTGAGSRTLWLLACNGLADANGPTTIRVQAAAIYNTALSAGQVSAVTTAMNLL